MINKFITALSITSMILLASCATEPERNAKNPFDPITLKDNLIEGKTTQTEMLQTFGAPDMVTESSSKEDVWTYNQVKHESKGNAIGGGLIGFIPVAGAPLADIWGSTRSDESSSKSVTLMVIFNKKKIVKSYSLNKVKI